MRKNFWRIAEIMPEAETFRVVRSARRKNIAIRVGNDGVLELLAPETTPDSFLRQLVEREHQVIARLRKQFDRHAPLELAENAAFMLLGRPYPLHLTHRLRLFDHGFMVPDGSEEEKKTALIALYRELSSRIIPPRVEMFQDRFRLKPRKIGITSAATRWGSCSSRKTVSFSWKLVQCPLEAVDYVVVHELSHLEEMNHSPAFWRKVGSVLPDYELRRAKLNAFARTLPRW